MRTHAYSKHFKQYLNHAVRARIRLAVAETDCRGFLRGKFLLMKTWRFLTIMLAALSAGLGFYHLLQMPARMSYDGPLWLRTMDYYRMAGPSMRAFIEGGAFVTAIVLPVLLRHRRMALRWAIAAAVCFFITQALWWIFLAPVNGEVMKWNAEAIPANWTQFRVRWEFTHAARAIIEIIGLGALVISVLCETPGSHFLRSSAYHKHQPRGRDQELGAIPVGAVNQSTVHQASMPKSAYSAH
jgi:hypothetical protein